MPMVLYLLAVLQFYKRMILVIMKTILKIYGIMKNSKLQENHLYQAFKIKM